MERKMGKEIINTVIDTATKKEILNKTSSVLGMLFPYIGARKNAVDIYLKELEKADMSAEAKAWHALNIKKTIKQLKNQETIAELAVVNAKEGTDFSKNTRVDEEWLERFMESAGYVSSEEMQLVWAKILANEFETPGSTPPNMRRILTEITPNLAYAFRQICSMYVILFSLDEKGDIITGSGKKVTVVPYCKQSVGFFESIGLSFVVLSELETLGLIRFEPVNGYKCPEIMNNRVVVRVENHINVFKKSLNNTFAEGSVIFTAAGVAVRDITDPIQIPGYYETVRCYYFGLGQELSEDHDYILIQDAEVDCVARKTNDQ